MSNIWFRREGKRKVIFRMDENETEIDFVLIKKEHQRFMQNVNAIPGEFLYALVIVDMDRKKMRQVEKEACPERMKISLLKDV